MFISVFSPKGGVGTTVTSALIAHCISRYGPTFAIDACAGDLHSVCGSDETPRFGFEEWIRSHTPTQASLSTIACYVHENLSCVSSRAHITHREESSISDVTIDISSAIGVFHESTAHCVIDCGTATSEYAKEIIDASDVVVVVMRSCYGAMVKLMEHSCREKADVCVFVKEAGRTISVQNISELLDVSRMICLDARRDFARSIDAGVLVHRPPHHLVEPIIQCVDDLMSEHNVSTHDIFDDAARKNNQSFWGPQAGLRTSGRRESKTSLLRGWL